MSATTDHKTDEKTSDENQQAAIAQYLQSPRKKRKNYVLLAFGSTFDQDLSEDIQKFVKAKFPHLSIAVPKDLHELRRQFARNISLLVVDDEFGELSQVLEIVKVLKTKRTKDKTPVLFFTRRPHELISAYHDILLAYQELDEFCAYSSMEKIQIFGKIKAGIESKNKRKSRRYHVNLPVRFYHLRKDQYFDGQILDLSVHGALLQSSSVGKFRDSDQIKISIPISKHVSPDRGEYLRLSAKVRRVFIAGDRAGVSFEYLGDYSMTILTEFITRLVTHQIERRKMSIR